MMISARNQIKGTIKKNKKKGPVSTEVVIAVAGQVGALSKVTAAGTCVSMKYYY
jgi:molybdopterin-binding protein